MGIFDIFKKQPKPTPASQLSIAESIYGTWFYHLSRDGGKTSVCGAKVMKTLIPLKVWGTVGHLHERYCAECVARTQPSEWVNT